MLTITRPDLVLQTFTFRELTSPEELLEYFRLRHLVYCREGYLQPNATLVDVDRFDAYSRFVGAFYAGRMVAGARMILPEGQQPHAGAMRALTARGQLPETPPRPRTYHSQDIFDLKALFGFCVERQQSLVEFGRTVVEPEFRSTGLGLKIVFALYGLALHHGLELGWAAVPPKLRGFYERCGCRVLESKGQSSLAGIDTALIALVVDLRNLPASLKAARRAERHLTRYGSWIVCSESKCLSEHRHLPAMPSEDLWRQVQPVVENIPAVEIHSWEPVMNRLPLLRGSLQLQDDTLWDGLRRGWMQFPELEDRVRLLEWMVELGVSSANLGPHQNWLTAVPLVEQVVRRRLPLQLTCCTGPGAAEIRSLARLSQSTGSRLEASLAPLGRGKAGLKAIERSVRQATTEGLSVLLWVPDAVRTPPSLLEPLLHSALQFGASAVCLSDSTGQATPAGTTTLIGYVKNFLRDHGYRARLHWKGHDDRGMALANCLAAVEAGADRIHASALGAGERVGSASLERLLLQLHRLSGRPLRRDSLHGYLGWARHHLSVDLPVDLAGLLNREVSHV